MKTPRVDAAESDGWNGDAFCVDSDFARELEVEAARWREVANKLAQRLRSIPETGATRFPDARDREALEEYDSLTKETT